MSTSITVWEAVEWIWVLEADWVCIGAWVCGWDGEQVSVGMSMVKVMSVRVSGLSVRKDECEDECEYECEDRV